MVKQRGAGERRGLPGGASLAGQALGILLLFGLAGCRKEAPKPPPPPKVAVAPVIVSNVPIFEEWVATLSGFVDAEIRPQVTGYLISQNYQEGALVKKGDELFRIDDRPFQAALDQALGELERARAEAGKTELDVKRLGPLAQRNAVSRQEYDDAVQANLAAKADVTAAEAAVERARLEFNFTRILSPVDGIAGLARAQIGDLVSPSSPALTTVSSVDPIKVYFTVSEQEYLDYVRHHDFKSVDEREAYEQNLDWELILADGETYSRTGKFYAADRAVDVRTGALRLAAVFPNPANILRPGQFARIRTMTRVSTNAVLVPQRALLELQGKYLAGVVGPDQKAQLRPVTAGPRTGSWTIVEEGLNPGDTIVVEGIQKIRSGMAVRTEPWNPENLPDAVGGDGGGQIER